MEFLVEFEVEVPNGTPETEVERRTRAEAAAAARLVDEGRLLRLWRRNAVADDTTAIGLYAADSEAQLDALLRALPLADWMQVTVIPLAQHPSDPGLEASAAKPRTPGRANRGPKAVAAKPPTAGRETGSPSAPPGRVAR
jgi:muconolactone D-isomerase